MPNEPTWNLKDLLPEHKGFEFDVLLNDVKEKVFSFEQKRSWLQPVISFEKFNSLLKELEQLDVILSRVGAFGHLWFSEDTTNDDSKAFVAKIEQISTELENKLLFFSLWWKSLDENNAQRLMRTSGINRYFLEHMRKLKVFTLSEHEEKIINLKDTTGSSTLSKVYDILSTALRFPLIVDGKRQNFTLSELKVHFTSSKANLREGAYKSLFKVYKKQRDVLGELYCSIVRDWHNESITLRKYPSHISVRNKANDIPDGAVEAMLSVVRDNRELFQDYFRLKAKWLGLEKMSRYHIYAPLEKEESKVSFNDAAKIVLDTFNTFSPEIARCAKMVFDKQHVHAVLGKNKQSGAYCYSVTPQDIPYVLLNYTGRMDDVITMAHEMGHAVHSLLAKDKTIFTFHAPIPFAETASVFGELITTHRLIEDEKSPALKKHLLAGKLDDVYATVMRQCYFTVFEQKAHEMIQDGSTIKDLQDVYYKQLKEQFGDMIVPKEFQFEWLYIPHIFHTPFYCYSYSFGNLLTFSLYQRYLEEGSSFVPKYLKLLSYGGSEEPEKILHALGMDMTKKEFWQKGFGVIKEMLSDVKKL